MRFDFSDEKTRERMLAALSKPLPKGIEGYVIEALQCQLDWIVAEGKKRCDAARAEGDPGADGIEAWADGYLCAAATSRVLARSVVFSIAAGVPPGELDYRHLLGVAQIDAGM